MGQDYHLVIVPIEVGARLVFTFLSVGVLCRLIGGGGEGWLLLLIDTSIGRCIFSNRGR